MTAKDSRSLRNDELLRKRCWERNFEQHVIQIGQLQQLMNFVSAFTSSNRIVKILSQQ